MSKITVDQRKTFEYYRRTYVRDSYRCIYCGRDMIASFDDWMSLEIDHLHPTSKGGKDEEDNLVTCCNVCNKLKSNFDPGDLPEDQQIEITRKHVLEKRMAEQLRWLKALQQYDHFKIDGELKEDSNLLRFDRTKPEKLDG